MSSLADTDFKDFRSFLLKKQMASNDWLNSNLKKLRAFHGTALSFAIWDHCLRTKAPNQTYFMKETRSDCINSVFAVFTGSRKAANALLRGIIESILRHIYYVDHPIEFQVLMQDEEYMQFRELLQYARKHPILSKTIREGTCLQDLERTYKTSSKYVHAHSLKFMQLSKALEEVEFNQRFFDWYVKKLVNVASNLNLLLILIHHEEFSTMSRDFRRAIMRTISKKNKKILSKT